MRLLHLLALLGLLTGCGRDPEPQPTPSPIQPTPTSDVHTAPNLPVPT